MPAMNAAMKPEPPSGAASPYASAAPATGTIWSHDRSIRRRLPAYVIAVAATTPARAPAAMPYPISSTTSRTACVAPTSPASASAIASTMNRSGTQIPSFRPLSTLRPWRIRDGSLGSVTTAWPSAASVGASTTARTSASGTESAPNSTGGERAPSAIVSGSPMPSRRAGTAYSRRSVRRSMREASTNNTNVSVASARSFTASPVGDTSRRSSAWLRPRAPLRRRRSRA